MQKSEETQRVNRALENLQAQHNTALAERCTHTYMGQSNCINHQHGRKHAYKNVTKQKTRSN